MLTLVMVVLLTLGVVFVVIVAGGPLLEHIAAAESKAERIMWIAIGFACLVALVGWIAGAW